MGGKNKRKASLTATDTTTKMYHTKKETRIAEFGQKPKQSGFQKGNKLSTNDKRNQADSIKEQKITKTDSFNIINSNSNSDFILPDQIDIEVPEILVDKIFKNETDDKVIFLRKQLKAKEQQIKDTEIKHEEEIKLERSLVDYGITYMNSKDIKLVEKNLKISTGVRTIEEQNTQIQAQNIAIRGLYMSIGTLQQEANS